MATDDTPNPAPNHNRVRIPAVLVPAGQHPGPDLYNRISQPVRLPVQIRPRGTNYSAGSSAPPGPGDGLDSNANPAAEPTGFPSSDRIPSSTAAASSVFAQSPAGGAASGRPNDPTRPGPEATGARAMAPRRGAPRPFDRRPNPPR
jgi:hypothetical protein